MIPRQAASTLFWSVILLSVSHVRADVKLHNLFTDHMVLQRNIAVPVWGWADEGEEVTVEFRGQKVSTKAKDGKWMVKLKKLKAGGPDELKVTGKNSITISDVLVGEVWIGSGQSNMEWPMRASAEPEQDIANSSNPHLRLFTVPKLKANTPVNNVDAKWQESGSNSVYNFSAVAYYFGSNLQKALGVPVGMIHTSWGGSPAEVWMRDEVLTSNKDYKRDIVDAFSTQIKRHEEAVAKFESEQEEAKRDGKPFNKRRPFAPWKPSELYNGMIAPLIPYAIKGAIWYQGESNAGRAHQYRTLMADMVRNWREDWAQGNFPFFQVQLAPFTKILDKPGNSDWAELREAQVHVAKTLPNMGVAVITDFGDPNDIHPKWKKPVGYRLSLAARAIAYGEDIPYSGPTYRRMKVKDGKAVVSFNHADHGLRANYLPAGITNVPGLKENGMVYDLSQGQLTSPLAGFSIAGEDQKFVWAKAEIDGNKVVVSSPEVPNPVAVRYGWANCPVVNLFNGAGLPASPFRTDDWPMITAPKQEAKK